MHYLGLIGHKQWKIQQVIPVLQILQGIPDAQRRLVFLMVNCETSAFYLNWNYLIFKLNQKINFRHIAGSPVARSLFHLKAKDKSFAPSQEVLLPFYQLLFTFP